MQNQINAHQNQPALANQVVLDLSAQNLTNSLK